MPVEVPLLGGHDPASEDGQFHVVPVAGPHDVAEPPPTRQRGPLIRIVMRPPKTAPLNSGICWPHTTSK